MRLHLDTGLGRNRRMSRTPRAECDPQFLERWSPRSFTDEPLTGAQIAALFEAARWAPSCFNEQPWCFVYATAGEERDRIASLIVEGNRAWSDRAPLLGIAFARRAFARNDKPNRWAAFDTGAASFSLALQASRMGLAAHFMGGFDEDASYEALGVPREGWEAMAAFAVGHPGPADALPEPLREREAPNGRKEPSEIVFEGRFEAS